MRFANVRELKNKTSEILRLAEKEEVIVTSRGKPTAVIKGVSEEDFEDYLLENNPKFLAALERAKGEYIRFGGMSIEDYLKKRKAKHG
jgi:prevent-host-death family protein